MNSIAQLAITTGEPAGIGPDLIIALASDKQSYQNKTQLIVIADKKMMQQRAEQLKKDINFIDYDKNKEPYTNVVGEITILDIPCFAPVVAGKLDKKNSEYVLQTLRKAALGCKQLGSGSDKTKSELMQFDAMVTAPLHKGIINDAGIPFTGHTEFLAELTHAKLPVMMLAAGSLRVALATTHLPLKDVSRSISQESLRQVISIMNDDLINKFGINRPHILICGLNPHAGESGHLGMEEIEIIEPIIQTLKKEGLNLTGPLPADTLFTPKYLETADAVLAMYHDQGLPVLKHVGFGHAVNITLGLPIIRTSVDHGTALDLAGTGKASSGSMIAAINTAIEMVNKRKH